MARTPDIGEKRGEYLRVRLAPSESQHLDTVRGDLSRSDYVRNLITFNQGCPPEPAHHG